MKGRISVIYEVYGVGSNLLVYYFSQYTMATFTKQQNTVGSVIRTADALIISE